MYERMIKRVLNERVLKRGSLYLRSVNAVPCPGTVNDVFTPVVSA